VQADGDERILEWRASESMGVDVPGRHATQLEPPSKLGQPPVPGPVIAQKWAL
jgi:hypothetical protein